MHAYACNVQSRRGILRVALRRVTHPTTMREGAEIIQETSNPRAGTYAQAERASFAERGPRHRCKRGRKPFIEVWPGVYCRNFRAERERERERERACLVTARRGRPSNGAALSLYIATYNQRNRDVQRGGCLTLNFFPPLSLLRG